MFGFGGNKKKEEEEAKAKQEQVSQAMRSMSDQLAEKGKKIAELEDELDDAQKDAAAKAEAEKALMQARVELAKIKGELNRAKADAAAKATMEAAKVEAKPAPGVVLGGGATVAPASGGLAAGTTAYVRKTGGKNLRLRDGHGLDTNAFAGLPPGTSMTILEGPVEDDGYPWYRIRVSDGREGWVAGTELVTSPE